MSENQRRLGDLSLSDNNTEQASSSQMLEDERFAIMLQNEEFMAELRGNREFLSALEAEAATEHFYHHQQQQHHQHHPQAVMCNGIVKFSVKVVNEVTGTEQNGPKQIKS
jgi:hypothetical protein